MTVNFAEVRTKVPLASVLHHYKIHVKKRSSSELVAQCPFISHTSKQHEWTLAISTEKNKWFCHSETCRAASNRPKGGDVIDFVAMMENLTLLDAAKRLAEIFALLSTASNEKGAATIEAANPSNKPLAFELKNLNPAHPMIMERGISLETAKEFGIGYHAGKGSMSNRICFPLHENGSVVGYAGRWVGEPTPENPKWKLPAGLARSFLFGLERCNQALPLMLVEGAWSVLWFAQQGFQSVAILGSTLTPAQVELLAPFADIRICLDGDAAGRTAAQIIYERLKPTHKVSKAFLKV